MVWREKQHGEDYSARISGMDMQRGPVGARDLGMGVTFLDPGSSQMGKKESLADTAKVLGRMYDGIEYRGLAGISSLGPQAQKCIPSLAHTTIRELATLLRASPKKAYMLDLSAEFKRMKNNGVEHKWLTGKQVVLLFEKTSTRTRCAFEVGARDLGMGVTFHGEDYSARISGMDMQRGPPRPRDSSAEGISRTVSPASRRMALDTSLRW